MIPQNKKHFAIIVHFNSPSVTRQAVDSLLSAAHPPEKIIVVNHSRQALTLPSPADILQPRKNLGYAGGINFALGVLTQQGLRGEDIVVLMNNDLLVADDAFTELRRWWSRRSGPALLGPSFIGRSVSGPGRVSLISGRAKLLPESPAQTLSTGYFFLPYLHGALLSASAQTLMRLQGLPEAYFLYWEDVLLARRAAHLGIPLCFEPRIKVFHQEKDSPAGRHLYYLVRNGAAFLQNETPPPWRGYWWAMNRLRLLYHSLPGQSRLVLSALREARLGPAAWHRE